MSRGFLSGGLCPGVFCPGGFCPDTDSSGLPYVKDRLLSCATRTLERISKNPLVEESITFNRINHAWDCFPTLLSVIRLVSL